MSDNIVMVTWDSVRADHMPMYGYHRDTCPFINEKADEGAVFENTQVSAVGTPASFTGIFTGEHASGHQTNPNPEHWSMANADRTLLPEVLQDEGYYTGGFHYNALMSRHFGWDRGWDVYEDHMWTNKREGQEGGWKNSVFQAFQKVDMANFAVHSKKMLKGEMPAFWQGMWDDIRNFVETAPEPWFLWILLIDTHHPYYAPEKFHEWNQPRIQTTYMWNYIMRRYRNIVGERRQSIINAYDNTMRYADTFVQLLSQTLEDNGYGDVPFIFHSDHGDEFGEHANYGHRPLMFDTVTRVPLIMWNIDETGRIEGPHSLLDLGNTVLGIADIDIRLGQGQTLFDDREVVTVQNLLGDHGRCAAVVDDEWKVMYHPEGDWGHGGHISPGITGYNHKQDPLEKAPSHDYDDSLMELLEGQLDWYPGEVTEGEDEVTAGVQERLSELGYLE